MKNFILVGDEAITHFENQNWLEFEESILHDYNGDIISWDNKLDNISTLLDMLSGWCAFTELSKQDLEDIETNTKIEIQW